MATATPITHIFSEINVGKYKSVKHYELIEVINGSSVLTNYLNISKDQNCAQSTPVFWLKVKNGKKWSKCISGLFKTPYDNIYKGDLHRKKHLIIVKYSNDAKTLRAYVFPDFYTSDIEPVLPLIEG